MIIYQITSLAHGVYFVWVSCFNCTSLVFTPHCVLQLDLIFFLLPQLPSDAHHRFCGSRVIGLEIFVAVLTEDELS